MKYFIYAVLLSMFASLLSSCAPVDYSQEEVFPQAVPDKALIYFYRSPGFIGSTYRFAVKEKEKIVGAMSQDSYFFLFTEPGEHSYYVDDKSMQENVVFTINAKAGNTHYVRVDVEYRVVGGNPVFTEVSKEEAMKLLPTRMYVVPKEIKTDTFNPHPGY